jgi:diaminopimelate decarboxylase
MAKGAAARGGACGGGFPVKYDNKSKSFKMLARKLNAEIERLFPEDIEILAEPGRFMVANAATLVAKVIGKAISEVLAGPLEDHIVPDDDAYDEASGALWPEDEG